MPRATLAKMGEAAVRDMQIVQAGLSAAAFVMAHSAAGAEPPGAEWAGKVQLYHDATTGDVVASTRGETAVRSTLGYSAGATSSLVMWAEARLAPDGSQRVVLAGEQLRYVLPKESGGARVYGPSDPDDPVYVGSPWKLADLRYRAAEVMCWSEAYWCAQIWSVEIVPDANLIDDLISNSKTKDLRVSLSRQRKVEWRVPRGEIIAVQDALRSAAADVAQGGESDADGGAASLRE